MPTTTRRSARLATGSSRTAAGLALSLMAAAAVLLVVLSATPAAATARSVPSVPSVPAVPAKPHPLSLHQPLNVSYDHRALLINGERTLLLSGSIHYARSTPGMWPSLIAQAKAAGLTAIDTYVFWNLHQPQPGVFVFSDTADIFTFLKLCQEAEMYVVLRIGPYVCAEWNYGGLPFWLRDEPGMVFRTYNQPWMDAMGAWMSNVTTLLRPFFASSGGPIILAQVENEYGDVAAAYGADGLRYAQWAIAFAQSLDIGVPWIMCQQGNIPEAINTCNGFYCDQWLPSRPYADAQPALWTESWGGWFQHWSEPRPTRPAEDQAYAMLAWFAKGGAGHNHYMFHGGTSFGRTVGGPWIITSYDYDVPLDEYGFANEPKYSHFALLHQVLLSVAPALLAADPPAPVRLEGAGVPANVDLYDYGADLQFLLNANSNATDATAAANVSLDGGRTHLYVPPWCALVLTPSGGGGMAPAFNSCDPWQSATAVGRHRIAADGRHVVATAVVPSASGAAAVVAAAVAADAGGSGGAQQMDMWTDLNPLWSGVPFVSNSTPLALLSLTNDTTDYCWFRREYLAPSQGYGQELQLMLLGASDYLMVWIDGVFLGGRGSPIPALPQTWTLPVATPGSPHRLDILAMTMGQQNFGVHLEAEQRGLQGDILIVEPSQQQIVANLTDAGSSSGGPPTSWYMQPGLLGEYLRVYQPSPYDLVPWQRVATAGTAVPPLTWLRMQLDIALPQGIEAPTALAVDLTGLGKGHAWINGFMLGRYWLLPGDAYQCQPCDAVTGNYTPADCRVDCGLPSQSVYHVPLDWLQPASPRTGISSGNTLVVLEELGGRADLLQLLQLNAAAPLTRCATQAQSNSSTLTLDCPPGTTVAAVQFASFGLPTGTCGSFVASHQCNAPLSLPVVEAQCLGRSYCDVPLSAALFGGDPCPAVASKELYVQATCA